LAEHASDATPQGRRIAMDAIETRSEVNKRLTLNWLIQGAAQHAGMTAHHLVRDELDVIHPDLVRLYDLYALRNLFQYWSPDSVLLLGWPPRFWKRAASDPSHPFFDHPLLSRHGGTLAATAKRRAVERAKEKGVRGNPSLIPHRLSRELARVRVLEAGHAEDLIELAKRATSLVWGIPADRLDANLSTTITLDDADGAETLRGRMLGTLVVGWARVAARDGAVDVVARATNWYFLAKELVKGTAELICLHGLADLRDDVYQDVLRHADKIEYEPWMLQTGGELWRRLLGVLPKAAPLQRVLMHLARLPAEALERVMLAVIEQPMSARDELAHLMSRG
jgi:hypothetical protein